MKTITRFRIWAEDALRFHPAVRAFLCRFALFKEGRRQPADNAAIAECVEILCKAIRLAPKEEQIQAIEERVLRRLETFEPTTLDPLLVDKEAMEKAIPKAAILKPFVSDQERGVVFISFEYQWMRLLQLPDLKAFARRYRLVVSPTWCPPHAVSNYFFPRAYPDTLYTLISNEKDVDYFSRMAPNYRVVPLYASSWVHPDIYTPRPFGEKDNDILVLSNFGKYKRHHALFRALQDMPPEITVTLIGQKNGSRTAAVLLGEADAYGVRDRINLRESVTDAEVVDTLTRSKVSLVLSRREGSCVAVVESMFADTPVGIFTDAGIGSRAFINEHTGRFLEHEQLGKQLTEFVARAGEYAPRQWVLENGIDCFGSTRTLNAALKADAEAAGEPWTRDIFPHHWRPDPTLLEDAHRADARAERLHIRSTFGLTLGKESLDG